MKFVRQLISAVTLLILASAAVAQTEETSNNLIINPGISGTSGWTTSGMVGGVATVRGDGYTSALPGYTFSFNQGTIAQTYAINQALSAAGTGVQIHGFDYGFQYQIWCANTMGLDCRTGSTPDILSYTATITNSQGQSIYSNTQDLSGGLMLSPASIDVQQRFANPHDISSLGNFSISFTGQDGTFWGGNHGPTVGNVYSRAVYSVAPVDPCISDPQSSPSCPGYRTYYTFSDDSYVEVPLPFAFPFYGQTFTNSWMHSNGVVSFLNPTAPLPGGGSNPGAWAYCCGGPNLSQNTQGFGAQFNYIIAPLWTDLYPVASSRFWTTQDSNHIRYGWENIAEISNMSNLNTFSLELRPTGYIGINYDNINIQNQNVTVGTIGDLQLDEKTHQYFGVPGTTLNSWSLPGTVATDCSDPLVNANCPGYAQAYFDQQCSISALYSPACPGYDQAYFTQQCSFDTLYDPACPGYATAYYDYQCSLDALYHTGCPGYAQAYFDQQCSADALYDQNCPGYAVAYFDQQCSLDALYDVACPLYADAYYVQQCNLDPLYDSGCTGYAQAYFDQQCGLDSLYDQNCPGYAVAYFDQQCSIDALYDNTCPGYADAFYKQQCSLDALYDNACPGYAEAFAKKYILAEPVATSEPVVEIVAVAVVEEAAVATITEAAPAPTASASPADSATAPVQLVAEPAPAATVAQSAATTEPTRAEPAAPAPRTTRQQLAERRMAAAREKAAESARENPGETAEAMDSADSMEQQVELQNVVLGAMGFVPGFDSYGRATVPDAAFYPPLVIYPAQQNIDTPAGRRLLGGSDRLHQEMVDAQYK